MAIPLIVNEMKNNGSELPIFKTDEDRSYFRVIFPIHQAFLEQNKNDAKEPRVKKSSKRRNREELRVLVLELLAQKGNLSTNELAKELGYKSLNDTLRAVVKEMLESEEVVYLYPDKPNSRNQKIYLKKEKPV